MCYTQSMDTDSPALTSTPDPAAHIAEPSEPRRRLGGRSARVRAAVLAATMEALLQAGYEALSIGEIAARSGVHESSIYRRWGTKAALVAEALQSSSANQRPTPDTGSFRTDLIETLRQVIGWLETPVGQATSLIVTAADPDLAEVRRTYWLDRLARARLMVERAQARGELSSTIDPDLFMEAAMGPLFFRRQRTRQPLDPTLPERIANLLLNNVADQER